MRHCRDIRNQYAHSTFWNDNTPNVAFANLEALAQSSAHVLDLRPLTHFHLDMPLLTAQAQFFSYTETLFAHVNFQGRFLQGKIATPLVPKPLQIPPPPLHIP